MTALIRPRLVCLLAAAFSMMALSTSGDGLSAGNGGRNGAGGWERKLDPFLRRRAGGVVVVRGRFADRLPPGSVEVARALPGFVQVDRSAAPVLHVKAGLDARALATEEARAALERELVGIGVQIQGRVGEIASLRVPAA